MALLYFWNCSIPVPVPEFFFSHLLLGVYHRNSPGCTAPILVSARIKSHGVRLLDLKLRGNLLWPSWFVNLQASHTCILLKFPSSLCPFPPTPSGRGGVPQYAQIYIICLTLTTISAGCYISTHKQNLHFSQLAKYCICICHHSYSANPFWFQTCAVSLYFEHHFFKTGIIDGTDSYAPWRVVRIWIWCTDPKIWDAINNLDYSSYLKKSKGMALFSYIYGQRKDPDLAFTAQFRILSVIIQTVRNRTCVRIRICGSREEKWFKLNKRWFVKEKRLSIGNSARPL